MEKEALNKESNDYLQTVVFDLADECYGVRISDVHEIIRMQDITRVPNTEEFIEGVINLRGKIIPVIDLRKKFGLQIKSDYKHARIIVVKVEDNTIGMIVDGVSEVLQILPSSIESISSLVSSQVDTEFLSGIAKVESKLIIMLDLQKVLNKKEKTLLKEVEPQLLSIGEGK